MEEIIEIGGAVANGIWRRVFDDAVTFQPDFLRSNADIAYEWDYAVFKYPFVLGFHVVYMDYDGEDEVERVLSSHKTLHEAMGVCRVLLASGGYRRV